MEKLKLSIILALTFCYSIIAVAGNEDRAGEAGASQLLINPWTKSVGFGGANTSSAIGLEAMGLNVAGLAYTRKTEILINHKRYLYGGGVGSGISINTFGFAQKIGETGVIGLSVMSMNMGDIEITEVNHPEGGIGYFSPKYTTMDLGYAKTFSNSISGGLSMRIISESIPNASTRGVAFDAGVRYVTGDNDQLKFGIALKNVGPTMKYSGDGLSFTEINDNAGFDVSSTQDHRASSYQLPSLLNIGASYDIYVSPKIDSTSKEISADHKIVLAGNFTSNSFTKDQYRFGVEYAFRNMFMLRGGYVIEQGTWFDSKKRTSAFTGPAFGASFVAPLGKKGTTFAVHYAYQMTESFSGVHSIGVKLDL